MPRKKKHDPKPPVAIEDLEPAKNPRGGKTPAPPTPLPLPYPNINPPKVT